MSTPQAKRIALALVASLASSGVALGQVEYGGEPVSSHTTLREVCPTCDMEPVDVDRLRAEDQLRGPNEPYRWGEVLEVDLGLQNAGVWEEIGDGHRVWRLRVHSPGAHSIMLMFSRFQLPEGAELYVYNDDRSTVRGAYTYLNNKANGEFAIQPTPGEAVTLEYFEHRSIAGAGEIHLNGVVHDYADVTNRGGGVGGSANCNVNQACDPTLDLQANSVVQITGPGTCCSGVLLNNTFEDGAPLVLTAGHCGNLQNAVFLFNYKRQGCSSGITPQTDTVQGSIRLEASGEPLDFQLVRLTEQIPASYGPIYSGWDCTDTVPANTRMLHHPQGDRMKVSMDDDPPQVFGAKWRILRWDSGITEGGSSGAPLFDPAGRFIGHMDEGASNCFAPQDDRCTRLAEILPLVSQHLDPLDTGLKVIDPFDPSSAPAGNFDVVGTNPIEIPVLMPGTDKALQILGDGFTPQSTVDFNGAPLDPALWDYLSPKRIILDMPKVPIGTYRFTVNEGTESCFTDSNVVELDRVVHQSGNGDAGLAEGNTVNRQTGVDITFAGPVGRKVGMFFSRSNLPSIHPLISFGIGNMFTDFNFGAKVIIPPEGCLTIHCPIGPGLGQMTIYTQAWDVTAGFPGQVSNIQETYVTF